MKPLDGTFAHNAEAHGVAGLHIDGGRIGTEELEYRTTSYRDASTGEFSNQGQANHTTGHKSVTGRWPANVLFDEESGAMLGEPARFFYSSKAPKSERWVYLTCDCETVNFNTWENEDQSHSEPTECTSPPKDISEATLTDGLRSNTPTYGSQKTDQSHLDFTSTTPTETSKTTESKTYDSSALPNTNGSTQDANCETENGGNPAESVKGCSPSTEPISIYRQKDGPCTGVVVPAISPLSSMPGRCVECGATVRKTSHPTQKPVELLRYLCKLTATPTGGTVLDPFMGSGSTGVACVKEGRSFVGIELDEGYVDIARQRIEHARKQTTLFT
jgi:hypothetical protein